MEPLLTSTSTRPSRRGTESMMASVMTMYQRVSEGAEALHGGPPAGEDLPPDLHEDEEDEGEEERTPQGVAEVDEPVVEGRAGHGQVLAQTGADPPPFAPRTSSTLIPPRRGRRAPCFDRCGR